MKTKNGKGLAVQIFVAGLLLCTVVSGAYYEQILGTIDFASEVEDIGLPEIQEGQKLPAVFCINSTYPVDYQVLWHDGANSNITTKHQITTTLVDIVDEAINPTIEQATTDEDRVPTYLSDSTDIDITTIVITTIIVVIVMVVIVMVVIREIIWKDFFP